FVQDLNAWIEELGHSPRLHQEQERQLDYFEMQQGPHQDWSIILRSNVPFEWKRLLLAGDLYPPGMQSVDFQSVVSDIAMEPVASLGYLDQLSGIDPRAAFDLRQLLEEYCSRAGIDLEDRPQPESRPEIPSFLMYIPKSDHSFRDELLQFSVNQDLHPAIAVI